MYLILEDLFSEEVSEDKFASYRYYPDIPGNSLGWGTVKKFLYGNLIFKPNHKKQLLYYQFLHPWIHFVPVKDDFSDLEEKFYWSQENIDETINYDESVKVRRDFQEFMFQRVIQSLKRVGLLTESIRPKFEKLGILKWEDFDDEDVSWKEAQSA